jgi:hypothetical protein
MAALDALPPQPIAPDTVAKSPLVTGLGAGDAVGVWQLDPLPLPMNVGDESIRFADLRTPPPVAIGPPPAPPTEPAPAPAPLTPSAPLTPPAAPAADSTAPEIDDLSLRPELFRVRPLPSAFGAPRLSRSALRADGAAVAARHVRRGGQLTFTLSESAWMRFTISRMVTKRGGRSRCPKTRRRRGGPVQRVGILERTFPAGRHSLAVSGRIRRNALSRGRYILRVRAVDAAANLSRIKSVRFTVC